MAAEYHGDETAVLRKSVCSHMMFTVSERSIDMKLSCVCSRHTHNDARSGFV
jgi:hypothetical protein